MPKLKRKQKQQVMERLAGLRLKFYFNISLVIENPTIRDLTGIEY